ISAVNFILSIPINLDVNHKIPFIIGTSPDMLSSIKEHSFLNNVIPLFGMEEVGGVFGPEALRTLNTEHQKLFSQWAVEWIKYQRTQALQAQALGNRAALFKALRAIAEMPTYQLDPPYNEEYAEVNTQMLTMLSTA